MIIICISYFIRRVKSGDFIILTFLLCLFAVILLWGTFFHQLGLFGNPKTESLFLIKTNPFPFITSFQSKVLMTELLPMATSKSICLFWLSLSFHIINSNSWIFIHSMCFNPFYHYFLCPNCLILGQWGPLKVVPVSFFFFSSCFLLTHFLVFDSFLATWQEKGYLMHCMPLTWNQPFLHGALVLFSGECHLKTRVWVVRVDLLLSRSLRLHWEEQESRRTEWI